MQSPYKSFFLQPASPKHRHYEVLRARFIEELSHADIARHFSLNTMTVSSIIRDFKHDIDNDSPVGSSARQRKCSEISFNMSNLG